LEVSGGNSLDHQESYLRTIFGYAGISDITFIVAQPMDMGLELQRQRIMEAKMLAKEIAMNFQVPITR